jgi:hypothetical protein
MDSRSVVINVASSEENGQQCHGKMGLVALNHQTHYGRETRRDDERQESRGPGRQQGGCAKHHPAENEEEKDLIREMGFRVEQDTRGSPTGSRQARANGERSAPRGRLRLRRLSAPEALSQCEPRHRYQEHVQAPPKNDSVCNHTPLQAP